MFLYWRVTECLGLMCATHRSLEVHVQMPTWNPVIIASGERGVLKTAFGKAINLEGKKTAWCDKIFEILFIIFILKWTLLPPYFSSKRGKEGSPFSGKMGLSEEHGVSLWSEERAKSLPLNQADRAGFCKGAHFCGYRINRKLAFFFWSHDWKTHETQQVTSDRITFFLPENCWREMEVFLQE